jgi:hypothetical protein
MKGFYHAQIARLSKLDIDTAKDHYSKAASFYLKAGTTYPDDDEQAACKFLSTIVVRYWLRISGYLNVALQNLYACGAKVREGMAVMAKLRVSIPKMRKIWGNSVMAKEGRDVSLDRVLQMERDALKDLADGKITLDDPMGVSQWQGHLFELQFHIWQLPLDFGQQPRFFYVYLIYVFSHHVEKV